MSGVIGFVLGVCVWPFALTVAGAWALATERTGYRCRCGWSTGMRGALAAWTRYRWHRHVTRALLRRCTR